LSAGGNQIDLLDWITAIGSFITAIMAIWAYRTAKRELRLAQTPRLLAQLIDSVIESTHVIPGTTITGVSQIVFKTLVANLGTNIIDVWITVEFIMPDGVRRQAAGWYGANRRQLGPGEQFTGVLKWSEHIPDVKIDRYLKRYHKAPKKANQYIVILVRSYAQDATDHSIFCTNPEREYLFDLAKRTLIQYP
jgi:hypothetical protein